MKKITLSSSKINAIKAKLDKMEDSLTSEGIFGDYDPKPVIDCIEKGLFHEAAEWAVSSFQDHNGGSVDLDDWIEDLNADFEKIANS